MRTPIIIITTTTIKIPKPIPVLKIPPTTAHELSIEERRNKMNAENGIIFFIGDNFLKHENKPSRKIGKVCENILPVSSL